jgi:hypothetical protein
MAQEEPLRKRPRPGWARLASSLLVLVSPSRLLICLLSAVCISAGTVHFLPLLSHYPEYCSSYPPLSHWWMHYRCSFNVQGLQVYTFILSVAPNFTLMDLFRLRLSEVGKMFICLSLGRLQLPNQIIVSLDKPSRFLFYIQWIGVTEKSANAKRAKWALFLPQKLGRTRITE